VTFTVEFDDGDAVAWETTPDGGATAERTPFAPSLYVDGPDDALAELRERLVADPKVATTGVVERFVALDDDERTPVLEVACERVDELRGLAREVRHHHERGRHPPGTFRIYDVDLAPQFRYCLARDADPVPDRDLRLLELGLDERALAGGDLAALTVDGEQAGATERGALEALAARLAERDPDVLVVSHGDLVPLVVERARALGVDCQLGRRPGYEQLAGESTFESYGRVGHSPARYDVPGRVLVDASASFLWEKTNLRGLLDLVAFSGKPLQEVAWASIGNVLTAVQIREARERDVLVPAETWRPEAFKSARTLHAADRGGATLAPEVGVHRDVVEADFASLYPRIMTTRNVSPDTVRCDCHDRADVPGLGYSICDERGFLVDVLEPLLDHRADLKDRIRAGEGDADALSARSDAIKWVLVACFGYQGYRNAKFGRIECHEAINAHAREILLAAKAAFEDAGWRVVHGIVDSVWATPREPDPESAEQVAARVSERVGIPLEVEGTYDWVCFAPRRESDAGALTRYFGQFRDGDRKLRGIEVRQRSTTAFVADAQRAMLDALDRELAPEPACEVLRRRRRRLRDGDVDVGNLVVRTRASKPPEEYHQRTRTVGALRRAQDAGLDPSPGQDVRYVVVDDGATRPRARVRLPFEVDDRYDAGFYADRLGRAAESVVSPFGWDRERVERYLAARTDARLDSFG
jgi:DNA polymerase I